MFQIHRSIEQRELSFEEFARAMKLSSHGAHELLEGRVFINRQIAKQLHLVLGQSIEYWEEINRRYWTNLLGPEGYERMERTKKWTTKLN